MTKRTVIACLWRGADLPSYSKDKFGHKDVLALARGVNRHITDGETIIICDDYYGMRLHGLHEPNLHFVPFKHEHCGGWSPMLEAYTYLGEGRALAVGLDTVFVGNCDWLFDWNLSPVGLPLDPYASPLPCNAVASFDKVGAELVWKRYQKELETGMSRCLYMNLPSEMALLRQLYREEGWMPLEDKPQKLLSYKAHLLKKVMSHKKASVVYFHGKPKLCDLLDVDIIKKLWLQ